MQIDEIKEKIYSPHFIDKEISFLKRKENWNEFTRRDYHFGEFLYPFSKTYFSPLNPMFLHELNRDKAYKNISVLLARDGILGLLKFFTRYPVIPEGFPHLLVPEPFLGIIPEDWLSNISTYRLRVTNLLRRKPLDSIQNIFVFIDSDPLQNSEQYIEKKIMNLEQLFSREGLLKRKVYTITKYSFDYIFHDKYLEEKHYNYFNILRLYKKYFPNIREEIKEYEVEMKNKSNSLFVSISENAFYFNDDYFTHDFLSDGIPSLEHYLSTIKPKNEIIKLSPFHGVEITEPQGIYNSRVHSLNTNVFKEILEIEDSIITKENHYLCSPDFFDYACAVQEVLKNTHGI
jgi:hypothetical protein